tara:strand:- start:3210 stop:3761 length:552 start_codon:yes stop_codon:yes gene_type:complete
MTERVDMEKIYRQYKQTIMLPPTEVKPEEEPSFLEQYQETISKPLAEITKASPEAYKESVPQMISGSGKGTVSGIGGLPGEAVGLASGILNMIAPVDYKGEEHDPNKSVGERFEEGYNAVPFKISDINDGLTQAGWKTDELGDLFTGVAEFVSPFAATTKGLKTGAEVIKKGAKAIKNKGKSK